MNPLKVSAMLQWRFNTLQQRTVILVLIPTFLLLTAMGWGGFVFARNSLLTQWSETAIANMQKAAHSIDMRLGRPKDLLERLKYTTSAGMGHLTFRYTVDQLRALDGVSNVEVKWPESTAAKGSLQHSKMMDKNLSFSGRLKLSDPQYMWNSERSTVLLYSQFMDTKDQATGSIEVEVSISDLVERLAKSHWWKSNKTLLIDKKGTILAHSAYNGGNNADVKGMKFGSNGTLEEQTMAQIQQKSHGTVFGRGNPPREISGFYRLADPPWFMVVLAPGETVLKPILKFRFYYALLFATAILIIIAFIRSMTTKMTNAIHKVSIAAEDLANGTFGPALPVQSNDEIGELTKSFNKMTAQLKQGMALQKAMEIAREVQQNFLPSSRYIGAGIEIHGTSRYCHETGGDFFDIVKFPDIENKVGAIVGDVVGHGIGAALLMASVRAMLRSRNEQPGDIDDIVNDVNKVLYRDTEASSNFVTLFYIFADPKSNTIQWIRAGHDPGILYYPGKDEFLELKGKGMAMGVDHSCRYQTNSIKILPEKQLIVIGSDGAWEAENRQGESFGKDRIRNILSNCSEDKPENIISQINNEIDDFLDGSPAQDDITFVVMKIDGGLFS